MVDRMLLSRRYDNVQFGIKMFCNISSKGAAHNHGRLVQALQLKGLVDWPCFTGVCQKENEKKLEFGF